MQRWTIGALAGLAISVAGIAGLGVYYGLGEMTLGEHAEEARSLAADCLTGESCSQDQVGHVMGHPLPPSSRCSDPKVIEVLYAHSYPETKSVDIILRCTDRATYIVTYHSFGSGVLRATAGAWHRCKSGVCGTEEAPEMGG